MLVAVVSAWVLSSAQASVTAVVETNSTTAQDSHGFNTGGGTVIVFSFVLGVTLKALVECPAGQWLSKIPYTVMMLMLGMLFGAAAGSLDELGTSMHTWR